MSGEPNQPDTVRILRWIVWSIGGGGAAAILTSLWVMSGSDEAVAAAYRADLPAFVLIWGALLSGAALAYMLVRRGK